MNELGTSPLQEWMEKFQLQLLTVHRAISEAEAEIPAVGKTRIVGNPNLWIDGCM